MSSTPKALVLSSKQLNKTLSVKKKPVKTIKNILSSKNSGWPVLKNTDVIFNEILNIGLTKLKSNSEIQGTQINLRECILFGINQIRRCIKKEECGFIMFDAETPQLLYSQLFHLTRSKNVPSVLIPQLKQFLFTNLKFKSSSICFKSNPQFNKLLQIISEKDKAEFKNISNVSKEIEKMETCTISDTELKEENSVVYLRRPNDGVRAFTPPSSKGTNIKNVIKATGYIKLPEISTTQNNVFKPLFVKRIQNNVNRKIK